MKNQERCVSRATETEVDERKQLEANVNFEAMRLYGDLLRSMVNKSSEVSAEDGVKYVEKVVSAFKKYFLG